MVNYIYGVVGLCRVREGMGEARLPGIVRLRGIWETNSIVTMEPAHT